MSDQDKQLIVAAIFFIAIGAVASFAFTRHGVNVAWKAEMVKRGFAECSRTTGEWKRKESVANEH